MNIFGLHPVVVFGTRGAEAALAAAADRGEHKACFARDRAERRAEHAQAQDARGARRRPLRRQRPEDLDLDRAGRAQDAAPRAHHAGRGVPEPHGRPDACSTPTSTARTVEVREIEKMGRKAVDSNQLFIDGLRDPGRRSHRRGGQGLRLHPARHESRAHPASRPRRSGLGRAALERAAAYANERIVFDRPIGQNQAIQHPLARLLDGARGGRPDGVQGGVAVRPRASPAAPRRTPPSTWPPKPASAPARPRCSPTAAWATRRSTTSSATCARP